jgi:type II secretory pathway pseudopilin PulG
MNKAHIAWPRKPKLEKFTLIELLVVVAVIVLLMSILFPSLQKAKNKTNEISCANNLKQIGMAFSMYIGDYNDFLPPSRSGATSNCWFSLVSGIFPYSYTESPTILPRKIMICPSVKDGGYTWSPWKNIGYTHNSGVSLAKASKAMKPVNVPLVFDGISLYADGYYGYTDWIRYSAPFRHELGINFLFLDTHIQYFKDKNLEHSDSGFRNQFSWRL